KRRTTRYSFQNLARLAAKHRHAVKCPGRNGRSPFSQNVIEEVIVMRDRASPDRLFNIWQDRDRFFAGQPPHLYRILSLGVLVRYYKFAVRRDPTDSFFITRGKGPPTVRKEIRFGRRGNAQFPIGNA